MRIAIAIPILLLAAGCATQDATHVARAECKVVPATTAGFVAGRSRPPTAIEQREAEMKLATSDYRQRLLRDRGMASNNIEEALRDCYLR